MRVQHEGNLLREVTQELLRMLEGLRCVVPLELVEAELEIPFIGKPVGDAVLASLADFRDVSVLAEDICASGASEIWKIRISVTKGHAAVLRVERYEAPAVT